MLEEQSIYNFQVGNITNGSTGASSLTEDFVVKDKGLSVSMCLSKQYSTMKSIKAWLFIAVRGLY